MNDYDSPSWGFRTGLIPPVIKALLISNTLIFLLSYFYSSVINQLFGLVPLAVWSQFAIWQPVTYMFLHGSFFHILFNMFVLWMFGSDLERTWGSRQFLQYYLICGIGAGLFNVLFQPHSMVPIIGASGAIYGLLVAFALMYPNRLVYLYFLFPVKVKYMVIVLVAIEFFSSMLGSPQSGVAHLAHLGGAVIGFIYIKGILQGRSVKYKVSSYFHRQRMEKYARQKEQEANLMEEVDRILDKINEVGYDNLTKREKKILGEASDKLSRK